jgi:hypothetical protein
MSPWWMLLSCRSPAAEPLSAPQMLASLEAMTREAPTHERVATALGVELARDGATAYTITYRGQSPCFPEVAVVERTGEGAAAPRASLQLACACLSFEQVTSRFGFAHADPVHPGAPQPEGERFAHTLPTGRLAVRYEQGCLREVMFEALIP